MKIKFRLSILLTSIFLLGILGIASAMTPDRKMSAAPPPTQGIHLTPIGNPIWKPADLHLFAVPIGTAATGYAEFLKTIFELFPPPNHLPHQDLGVGPGIPHQPPYTSEMATGVAALGFHEGVHFKMSEFSNGMGVMLAWMVVPAPGTMGSSPDFAYGPIIPNTLFPIHFFYKDLHNGVAFSDNPDATVPPLDSNLIPPFNVDGHSHFPSFFADNADFALSCVKKLNGSYEYQITMIDSSGSGWRIKAHFTVAP